MDTKKQRQRRRDHARLTRVANQQRMAARRAVEWIGTSKARLDFRYEISDLFILGMVQG